MLHIHWGSITPTENHRFGVRLLAGCVTFSELLTLSGPPLYHLYSESVPSTCRPRAVEKVEGGVHAVQLGARCGPGACQALAGEAETSALVSLSFNLILQLTAQCLFLSW